jgi:hypothetical protein
MSLNLSPNTTDESTKPPSEALTEAGAVLNPDSETEAATEAELAVPVSGGSRWIDYNTHELLDMISELEDERRWSRLREGIYLAIFIHVLIILGMTLIPRYVFNQVAVIDPIDALQKKNLQYLDLPPDALTHNIPKPVLKPVPVKPPAVDQKTLDRLQAEQPPAAPVIPQPTLPKEEAANLPTTPVPTTQPSPTESPRPSAVPARPSFAMNNTSPLDQMRQALRGPHSPGEMTGTRSGNHMPLHPGAGAGGVEVLSDTQGVDFNAWLQHWHDETQRTWDPLIPDEVNPPILKRGQVMIRFKVLPNGRLMDGSLILEGRSGDTALDRAAWGALTGSNYPALPKDFHGPFLELRALFMYNINSQMQ